jgi:hypothetical protein
LSEKEEPVHFNQLHSTPISSGRTLFDENAGVSSSDLSLEEIENLRPEIYREIARNSNDILFQKVHDAWKTNSAGNSIFPDDVTKAVIYFIRNPLDIAVSFAHHSSSTLEKTVKKMNDPDNAFCEKPGKLYNQLRQDLLNWSGHVGSWINDSGLPVVVLRYEDMLEDPYREFKKALDFIGLEFPENKIRCAIENSEFNKLKELEGKEGFNEKPIKMGLFFREGRSGTHRNHLDDNLVKEIISVHGKVMREYGYL